MHHDHEARPRSRPTRSPEVRGGKTEGVIKALRAARVGVRRGEESVRAMIEGGRQAALTVFVVDASVTMAWCFEDQATQATEAVLDRPRSERAL